MKDTIEKLCFAALGIGAALLLMSYVEAHPPCYEQPCRYVSVINPISGQLEQQYVCE